jgi:hypothetical protein
VSDASYGSDGPLPPGLVRKGVNSITAAHRKQLKVSKSGLSWLDLLASIATPQTGQCLMACGRAAITSRRRTGKP